MDEPLVDVVMATNRTSPFLAEALASVVAQTYPHWRLTVVDDGCPDAGFLDRALAGIPGSVILRHGSQGLPAARNAGIAAGRGELVAFLDDDDVWAPTKLAAQVASLTSAPSSIGSCTAGWYMDGDGRVFGDGWSVAPTSRQQFLSGAVPTPRIVSLLVCREAWASLGGFNTTYSLAEDNEFILRLIQLGELVCVNERLVGYRRHGGNMSSSGGLPGRRATRRLLREQIASARERGDGATAGLLVRKTASARLDWAEETVHEVAQAVRDGHVAGAAADLAWALRAAPLPTLLVTLQKLLRLARR